MRTVHTAQTVFSNFITPMSAIQGIVVSKFVGGGVGECEALPRRDGGSCSAGYF